MKTLAEEYAFNKLKEGVFDKTGYGKKETKLGRFGKYYASKEVGGVAGLGAAVAGGLTGGAALATIGAGAVGGMGAYYLYRKHKQAKAKAAMEQDPSKRNEMNVKANQLKQDANKKKMDQQKRERLQKLQQQA